MTTPDPTDAIPVLDLARLEASAGGDPALLQELVGLYMADSDAKLPTLLEAAEAVELHRMGRVAHGLKGSSAAMGCQEAAQAFRRIEEMGRTGETAGLDEAVARARDAWQRACARLRDVAA